MKKINFGIIAVLFVLLPICSGCKNKWGEKPPRAISKADNDIGVIVNNLSEALAKGEVLDTADYNFTGVLANSEGEALYVTPEGLPGKWQVEIIDSAAINIRNIDNGNLNIDSLRGGLVKALNLKEKEEYEGHNLRHRRQTI